MVTDGLERRTGQRPGLGDPPRPTAAPTLMVRLDRTGQVAALLPSGRMFPGLEPAAITGRHYLDFIRADERAQARQAVDLLLNGARAIELVLHIGLGTGKPVRVRIHATPWYEGKRVAGVQGTVRLLIFGGTAVAVADSLEPVGVSAGVQTIRRQPAQAERLGAIGALAASLAHEFNNPLCGIRSVLERMTRKAAAATDRDLLRLAIENCDRMSGLIRDLQRADPPISDERAPFDLHRAIDSVLLLTPSLRKRKAVVRRDFGGDPLILHGCESQIKQVLLHLIRSSGETLPEGGGEIRIGTDRTGDTVRIVLADTGNGIGEERLACLFDPVLACKGAARETGLGLSVSHGIVKAHGGDIEVASPPGQGTTFTVILPAGIGGEHQGKQPCRTKHPF